MDWFEGIEAYWLWFIAGLLLAGLELVAPGIYLFWLAIAALATGLIVFVSEPPLAMQMLSFVFLALISVFSARRWLRDQPILSTDPLLNNRAGRLVGETAEVAAAISGGSGRVHVGDSEWIALGPDADVGERVRIIGCEGAKLLVEPLNLIEGEANLIADKPE